MLPIILPATTYIDNLYGQNLIGGFKYESHWFQASELDDDPDFPTFRGLKPQTSDQRTTLIITFSGFKLNFYGR